MKITLNKLSKFSGYYKRELRDDLEHSSCMDGSILGTKSDFCVIWTDSKRTRSDRAYIGSLSTCHHPGEGQFFITTKEINKYSNFTF